MRTKQDVHQRQINRREPARHRCVTRITAYLLAHSDSSLCHTQECNEIHLNYASMVTLSIIDNL